MLSSPGYWRAVRVHVAVCTVPWTLVVQSVPLQCELLPCS